MQIINRCKVDINIPKSEKKNYLIAKNIVKSKLPGCEHYIITTFFDAERVKQNTTLIPPIMREEIINASLRNNNHIVVYQSSSSLTNLKEALRELPRETFYVYGFNQDKKDRNIHFKLFSEEGFINPEFDTWRSVFALFLL